MTVNDEQDVRMNIVRAAHGAGMEIATDEELAALIEAGERATLDADDKARAEGRIFLDEEHDRATIDGWWSEAESCKDIDASTAFARRLITDYRHDYGTICHAIAAGALAMANAVEQSPVGHITGFQAGAVGWLFMRHWHSWGDEPRQMVDLSNLLYPQFDYKFTTIDRQTAAWLQTKAAENIKQAGDHTHPNVIARWREIADGRFPAFVSVDGAS